MKKIKMIVLDVDGTLTDGKIYMGETGELMKAFNAHDAVGIRKLKNYNIVPVIITGRESIITMNRAKEMGIGHVYQGISKKIDKLEEIIDKFHISLDEVAYVGDDENDLECMEKCGLSCCPHDAVDVIKNKCDIVSQYNGGAGAVREIVEIIISKGGGRT